MRYIHTAEGASAAAAAASDVVAVHDVAVG